MVLFFYRKHCEVTGKDGCAGKAAQRAGKTVVTRPRQGPVSGPGTQRTDTLAAGARLWQGDSCRKFRTDRGMLSVGQREARRASWPYLGRPLGRLLLQRLPGSGVHGWVHGRGPGPRAPQPALSSPRDSPFTLGRGATPFSPSPEEGSSRLRRGPRFGKQAFARPAQGLSPRATGQRSPRGGGGKASARAQHAQARKRTPKGVTLKWRKNWGGAVKPPPTLLREIWRNVARHHPSPSRDPPRSWGFRRTSFRWGGGALKTRCDLLNENSVLGIEPVRQVFWVESSVCSKIRKLGAWPSPGRSSRSATPTPLPGRTCGSRSGHSANKEVHSFSSLSSNKTNLLWKGPAEKYLPCLRRTPWHQGRGTEVSWPWAGVGSHRACSQLKSYCWFVKSV